MFCCVWLTHHFTFIYVLTLILLTWRIRWAPNKASKWQMGFNLAFKVLNTTWWQTLKKLKHEMGWIIYKIVIKYIDFLLCCFQWMSTQNGVLKYTLLRMRRRLSRYERSVRKPCGVRFIASPWTVGLSLRHPTQVACALSVQTKCWRSVGTVGSRVTVV